MSLFTKKSLGVDIGVSSIKIVELSWTGNKIKLANYAEFRFPHATSLTIFDKETMLLSSRIAAGVLRGLFDKLKISQKKIALALPDFSTFFTTFTLPPMSETELPQAIEFEARHHVPLPLQEVVFDWQVISTQGGSAIAKQKILLVAVPKNVLAQYQEMAVLSKLTIRGMEAEIFGLMRSSIPEEKINQPVALIDFGWQGTTLSIVQDNKLFASYSFDLSSIGLTKKIATALNTDFRVAEKLKRKYGLDPQNDEVYKVLADNINSFSIEVQKVCDDFFQKEGKEVKDVILTGGTALLFGLKEYLKERLKKEVYLTNPFASLSYPKILENRLQKIGPSFAVAVGVALMGVE